MRTNDHERQAGPDEGDHPQERRSNQGMEGQGGVMPPGREKTVKNYTETETFKREFDRLKRMGASNDFLKKYTEIYMQFDENGMEIGTDYRLCVLAFEHPVK